MNFYTNAQNTKRQSPRSSEVSITRLPAIPLVNSLVTRSRRWYPPSIPTWRSTSRRHPPWHPTERVTSLGPVRTSSARLILRRIGLHFTAFEALGVFKRFDEVERGMGQVHKVAKPGMTSASTSRSRVGIGVSERQGDQKSSRQGRRMDSPSSSTFAHFVLPTTSFLEIRHG